jgi:HTH-type transcriptional repressor of NAD biosynthesis genes
MQFDEKRIETPISSTMIRKNPIKYWNYIPNSVRPYYTKKVCICGTESSGKTVMTELLANHYNVRYAKERAREICDTTFLCDDDIIKEIIVEQAKEIEKNLGDILLFSDTDLITAATYSEFLFNKYPDYITDDIKSANRFDLYIYLWNDVPYVEDGGRMGEEKRNEFHIFLYDHFKDKNIVVIKGDYEERFKRCVEVIEELLKITEF